MVHLKKLKCCAEIHNRNSRQKASGEKERDGEAWSIGQSLLQISDKGVTGDTSIA